VGKTMTDAYMALKLGYHITTKAGVPSIRTKLKDGRWDRGHSLRLPAFTTSLDAITAEVKSRGLAYKIQTSSIGPIAAASVFPFGNGKQSEAEGFGAPLALCQALCKYLSAEGE